jgi:hypothetical protein|tara:strand:+ start:664 stop:1143 length:480 start_codon:yes stop_codon:yes gene_type:complete
MSSGLALISAGALTDTYTSTTKIGVAEDGDVQWRNGKLYKFVKITIQDILVNEVLYPVSTDGVDMTTDYSAALSVKVGAVALGTVDISVAPYAWVQVCQAGTYGTARGDGAVAAGEAVIGDTAVDGEADTMAAGEEHLVFGFAMAADAGTPDSFAVQFA